MPDRRILVPLDDSGSGQRGLDNRAAIRPQAHPDNLSPRSCDALTQQDQREARDVVIGVSASTVRRGGRVDCWAACNVACGAAWSAPGATDFVNQLAVGGGVNGSCGPHGPESR